MSNDTWLSCSGGCNDLGIEQGCSDNCDANSPGASIEIKCSHGKKYYNYLCTNYAYKKQHFPVPIFVSTKMFRP